MANHIKGEVPFDVDGSRYVLAYDFNAICVIEEVFNLPFVTLMAQMQERQRAADLRTMFSAGLGKHQPGVTELQAGDIIGIIGPEVAAELVGKAFQAAFGPPEPEVASGASRPRKPSRPGV